MQEDLQRNCLTVAGLQNHLDDVKELSFVFISQVMALVSYIK